MRVKNSRNLVRQHDDVSDLARCDLDFFRELRLKFQVLISHIIRSDLGIECPAIKQTQSFQNKVRHSGWASDYRQTRTTFASTTQKKPFVVRGIKENVGRDETG